jgi:phage repressor protein C with HTH and peptisase S24 domain
MQASDTDISALDLVAIGARLRAAMATLGLDGTELAVRVGVPYGTMRAYVTGIRAPSAEFLSGCYRAFGLLAEWLLVGDGPMTRGGHLPDAPAAHVEQMVPIRLYRTTASAGPGSFIDGSDSSDGEICVSEHWLRKRALNPENLCAFAVKGNSMQTVLNDGDLVVMDTTDTSPVGGNVYVIRHSDALMVKYVDLLPGGRLRISSANSSYAPYEVDLSKAEDVAVLGRVVASMHYW